MKTVPSKSPDIWSGALCAPCLALGKRVKAHRLTKPHPTCDVHYEEWLAGKWRDTQIRKVRRSAIHVGARPSHYRLRDERNRKIQEDYVAGRLTIVQVASKYGIHKGTVLRICAGCPRRPMGRRPNPPMEVDWRGVPFS